MIDDKSVYSYLHLLPRPHGFHCQSLEKIHFLTIIQLQAVKMHVLDVLEESERC